jgi:O-6-methylguanine DNA methyltransferase
MNSSKVFEVVKKIPKGKVLTYKDVAILSNISNPRVVGNILHKNPDPVNIPCHRVVNFRGQTASSFAFGGKIEQSERLIQEGVEVTDNVVDLEKSRWKY